MSLSASRPTPSGTCMRSTCIQKGRLPEISTKALRLPFSSRQKLTPTLNWEGFMSRISLSLTLLASSFVLLMQAAPVHAQATRTWVSGVGDDVNTCSRTAPCKTFAGAISKTALNGEINCLDPGGFGAVTITKSITIDCHEIFASILNSGTNGVNIPFNSFNAADTRKTVRLRNLNFNGADTGVIGIRITGGAVIALGTVLIEDCLID